MTHSYYLLQSEKNLDFALKQLDSEFTIYVPELKNHCMTRLCLYNAHTCKQKFEKYVKKFKHIHLTNQDQSYGAQNKDIVFVAFGTDKKPMKELNSFLLAHHIVPRIIGENVFGTKSILEDLRSSSRVSKCAFIILTPDDPCKCCNSKSVRKNKKRPRQNVIFEYGLFMAKLPKDRVTPLHKGSYEKSMELPSDLAGIQMPTFKKNILERKHVILDALNSANIAMIKKI